MAMLMIGVSSIQDSMERTRRAFGGEGDPTPRLSFMSHALMWRVLTPNRVDIVTALSGQPALSIREVARRVGRDVKAVHGDVTALVDAGVIDRTENGVVFPYEGIHVDFTLAKAA